MTSNTRLVELTADTVDAACAISVRADQQHLVEPVARSLAEAYVHQDIAWPRLIVDGDRPVGFVMAFFDVPFTADPPGVSRAGLWRLNIDAARQSGGYGRFAVRAVGEEVRRRGWKRLTATWHPGPDGPEAFYRRLGFRLTGEMSGDQVVGELDLEQGRV